MTHKLELEALKETPVWEWPEDASATLLAILRDQAAEEADRVLAAGLAGDSSGMDDALADSLLSIVKDGGEPELLRAASAIALGPVLDLASTDGFDSPEDVSISEKAFLRIQRSLRQIYADTGVPAIVRRRVLEASVRAPQDWHEDAIRAAYADPDDDWKLTAVFAMAFVPGFSAEVLEALESSNPQVHREAVLAAGSLELDEAWPHLAAQLSEETEKSLLLATIEAVSYIRPEEAGMLLVDLADAADPEIAEAAQEAMVMAEGLMGDDDDLDDLDEDDDEEEDDEEDDDKDEKD